MLQLGASLLMMLAKARIINYDCNCSFIVLATVITIVNYDRHLFIVQATEHRAATIKIYPVGYLCIWQSCNVKEHLLLNSCPTLLTT
jgi:hypothetical protein